MACHLSPVTLSDVSFLFPNPLPDSRSRMWITSLQTSAAALTPESRSELQSDQSAHGSTGGIFLLGGSRRGCGLDTPTAAVTSVTIVRAAAVQWKVMTARRSTFSPGIKSVRLHHAMTLCRHSKKKKNWTLM